MGSYLSSIDRLRDLVRQRSTAETMVALIVDSPYLPGYAGVRTLDYYFDDTTFLQVNERIVEDFPGAVFIPGSWVEYGMAAEPSGWGVRVRWSGDQPPSLVPSAASLRDLAEGPVPNPETDGLMPLVLARYQRLAGRLSSAGIPPKVAAVRGPLTVASHVHGFTPFLLATQTEPVLCEKFLEKVTDLCCAFLAAQVERMEDPFGVLVLDDVVGMLSPEDAERFALPFLGRIFRSYEGLLRMFHNDTPNSSVYSFLASLGIDVFNFSHQIDLPRARALCGPDIVLMGNVPPLDLLCRGTPQEVREATQRELEVLPEVGPLLISPGGGVSPGTPLENLKAMVEVVRTYSPRSNHAERGTRKESENG